MRYDFNQILTSWGIPMEGFIDMLYDDNVKGAISPSMQDEYRIKTPEEYFNTIIPVYWVTDAFEFKLTPQGEWFWNIVDQEWKSQVATHWGYYDNGVLHVNSPNFENGCSSMLGGIIYNENRFKAGDCYKLLEQGFKNGK